MHEWNEMALEHHPASQAWSRNLREALEELNQEPATLVLAWELSGLAPLAETERETLFAVAVALLATQGQGHTRLALPPGPESPAARILEACKLGSLDVAAFLGSPSLASWVGGPGETRPLILEGSTLYTHRFLGFEQSLAERVKALATQPPLTTLPVEEGIFQDPRALDAEQRAAVEKALGSPLTLITGGPGTGKTTIVITILRALLRQGLGLEQLALAAPTGKAAQRMGEAIRKALAELKAPTAQDQPLLAAELEPRTLHRLLGWHPTAERFRHDAANPLPYRVVVVDESSMISQEHLHRLLQALAPGTRLVLLGDAEQLPSVEAGCAFRELVEALKAQAAHLQNSYRMRAEDPQGRNILSVARAINRPESGQLWAGAEPITVRERLEDLAHQKVELWAPGKGGTAAFLDRWFQERVLALPDFRAAAERIFSLEEGTWGSGDEETLGRLFQHFDGFRILCALRKSAEFRGVEEINAHFHRKMLEYFEWSGSQRPKFCAGEPVMMTRNDYTRGIFNGDQGLILKVRFDGEPRQAAVFPLLKTWRAFLLEPLREELDHAFAMTVHKSQGSEYEHIAVVLPQSDHKALTRELLYTALTRARRSVSLVGERERVEFAARNPTLRESGLGGRVKGLSGPT